jgi:4-amino-4-deoxy-L-arabinose transferase-like glycosyltransferase
MASPTERSSPGDEPVRVFSRPVLVALVGASMLGIGIWATSATKLIYTDEVAFFRDFQHLAAGRWDAIQIPHPPLYTLLGGLSVRLFGEGPLALRLPGLLAYLAALTLVPVVCFALTSRSDHARRAAVIALAVLAIHPLVLQGSLLLDIDNTVMTAALLGWIAVVGLSAGWPPWQQTLVVGATVALLLWTKLLPTPALFGATLLVVFAVARQRLLPVAAGLALGAATFSATFALFLSLSGSDLAVYLSTLGRSGQALRLDLYLRRAVMGGGFCCSGSGCRIWR